VELTWRTVPYVLRRSLISAFQDNCFGIAKGAAYSALLSFFPVLTSAATVLVQTRADFVVRIIEQSLSEVVPPGTEDLVMLQFQVKGERPFLLLVVAVLLSLWSASRVITSLVEGFHAAYRVPRARGFLRDTAVSISLVLLATVPLLGASAMILFGGQVEQAVLKSMKVDPMFTSLAWMWSWLSWLARYALAFGTTIAVTAILYYFGPYRRQRWRNVLPGAVVATILWLFATLGFGWYVRHIANYNVLYGSIGTSIALLVWMYVMAAIALLGCEFNAEFERLRKL
jgi:membrane protein